MSSSASGNLASNVRQQIGNSASLLRAADAVSNWPAFLLLSGTFILAVVSIFLFASVTGYFSFRSPTLAALSGFLGFLTVVGIGMVGINATGILLSDDVWGRAQRSISQAVVASAFACPRLLAVLLIEFVLFLVFLLALTLILFLCKMPVLGPLLYAFVLPVGSIVAGLVFFALIYIAIPLAAPALWNGASVKHALLMLQAVARKRLLTAIVMMVLLGLLTLVVVGFVWIILALGAGAVFSLSSAVIGVNAPGLENVMSLLMSSGVSGYGYAIGFGSAVLLLAGANPGILISLRGLSIIYREVSSDLSLEEDEKELNRRIDALKARAEQARQNAAASEPVMESAVNAASSLTCPKCVALVAPTDVFCGSCGHKLK